MTKLRLAIIVLGLLWSGNTNADHNLKHFVVIDCDLEASSNSYNIKKQKFGEIKAKQIKIRFKFNNKSLISTPRNTYLEGIDTIMFIEGINEFLKNTDQYLDQKFPEVNKRLAVQFKVYNFLDGLTGRKARIIKKTNESVHARIDKKSDLWNFKDDEQIVIYINRIDGTGHVSFNKLANNLTRKYYLTMTSLDGTEYSNIQMFRFFRCALAQAKF